MKKQNVKRYGILLLTTLLVGTLEVSATNNTDNNLTSAHLNKDTIQISAQESFLGDLVVRSDLIFRGKLIDISEALSLEEIPYTFVTYEIKEIVSGEYSNKTITIKYVGGTFPNGNKLSASNSPNVKLGEEAILMVQQSVDTGCDFVDCEVGRFLVEDGNVIAANESAVIVNLKGEVEYVSLEARTSDSYQPNNTGSNIPSFISHLKSLDKASVAHRKNVRVTALSANKAIPFQAYAALTQAGEPPTERESKVKDQPRKVEGSQFDQWEAEQLKKNGGNPVLDTSYSNNQE